MELLKQQRISEANDEKKAHKFWRTQPVKQIDSVELSTVDKVKVGPLAEKKTIQEVRQEPYRLPPGFVWDSIDIDDSTVLQEVYSLLTENYVEDDDNMFRFDYSVGFIRWALRAPGYYNDWVIGVRAAKTKQLLALITGIPATVHVMNEKKKMAEINFLCVHKKLRSKRLAPVLIKEVTRRVNLTGRWQAVYTAGVVVPTPVAKCRYYHRTINPVKLIAVGFSCLAPRMTMQRTVRLYKLPDEPTITGFRPMEQKDVPQVVNLLKDYLKKFSLWIEWDEEEVAHWLLKKEGVVYSYVVANKQNGVEVVTDLCSFYLIPSTVIGHEKYKSVNAAYGFYNVATSVTLTELMKNALIMAAKVGCDVFNCLDIMDNEQFLTDLKFGKGDGFLHYYLFNYNCPTIEPAKVGIVLL